MPRIAALPRVNASTYSDTAGCQPAVVAVSPGAAAAVSCSTSSSVLSWPVVSSPATPLCVDDDLRRARRVGRRVAERVDEGGEQAPDSSPRSGCRGSRSRSAYSATASGTGRSPRSGRSRRHDPPSSPPPPGSWGAVCRQLLHHVANSSTSTGVPMQSASVNAHRRCRRSPGVCQAGSSATVDVDGVATRPGGLHGSPATAGVEESGGAAGGRRRRRRRRTRAATAMAVISDRMVLLPHGFVAEGIAGLLNVTEIVAAPRSGRRWRRASSTPGPRRATPWRPRSPPGGCAATPGRRGRAV